MSTEKIKKFNTGAESIVVRGARTHNLKNIDVEMPRNAMVVITGMSGSGKSSLAFDTIFAEGQRRYVESLSSYARQFLKQMGKPDVDEITGLSPAISIDQKSRSNNPRSTVATITEIYDYLRVLYARVGRPHCILCGDEIKKLSNEEIVALAMAKVKSFDTKGNEKKVMGVAFNDIRLQIFSPVVRGRKGEYYQLLYDMLGRGFSKARIDGVLRNLRDQIILSKNKQHDIDFLVDEIALHEFKDAPKDAGMRLSEGIERALLESDGLVRISFDIDKELKLGETEFLLSAKFACPRDGFSFPEIEPRLFSFNSPHGACQECHGLGTKHMFGDDSCDSCKGLRLRPEALNVFIGPDNQKGRKNIVELTGQSIEDAFAFFKSLKLTAKEKSISAPVIREIEARLQFMLNVGLEYLSLNRRANTLSGGEAQRIRLASQLGSRLVGALYVLDEPTIGLHQRDNEKLIKTLQDLRDLGNTILVVEHDEDTIYSSDYIIDIGPKAGVHGGDVVVSGYLDKLLSAKKNDSGSRTLAYLREEEKIAVPEKRREADKGAIKIFGGKVFNIKNMNAEVPLGKMVCITGVSGSGKSSFMYEILHKNLQARLERKYRSNQVFNCASFSGTEYISRAILIDQSPIGRTPRSNIATYTGAFTFIRDLFAESEEARLRGWKANRFSFNVPGGRCEACQGNGEIAVEMHFLPTVYVTCDVCNGKRFDKETLKVKYKKKNIYEVLNLTVEEAIKFYEEIPAIYDRLKTLMDVGLGYVALGQSATTLSGGEAQRVKIASELYRPHVEKTMYLLDEPTVGLHYDDVANLIGVLDRLVAKGNTVVVIEHNMDLIKCADYLLDIGPEGGVGGGTLVAKGTPEEVANNSKSHTGKYLKKVLKK
ncbi:MAG: excinuclease ABC subunit UvrA [Candidatus Pacebacteria bacterium]|jgi:excinuclease ABC subunit A|nr:excinuclease ABC subunit UvrA [Candidatus Paceibacterota bacterium]